MTQDESVVTVMQVKNMALALRDAREQRDKLREALLAIVECWDGPLYKHEMLPLITKARAALKETEGE